MKEWHCGICGAVTDGGSCPQCAAAPVHAVGAERVGVLDLLTDAAAASEAVMKLRAAGVLHIEAKHQGTHVILHLAPLAVRAEVYETDVPMPPDATIFGAGR